ncbi:MAG: hypothetical protein FJZ59_05075 [Chlamydiae bacterium]|nr:hypothetical protein [Chlamydiota bacterium]
MSISYTWQQCKSNEWTDPLCWTGSTGFPNSNDVNTNITITSDLTISFSGQPYGFQVGNLNITTSNGSALSFKLPASGSGEMTIYSLNGNANLNLTSGGFYVIASTSEYNGSISVQNSILTLYQSLPNAKIELVQSLMQVNNEGTKIGSFSTDMASQIQISGMGFSIGGTSCSLSSGRCGNYQCDAFSLPGVLQYCRLIRAAA